MTPSDNAPSNNEHKTNGNFSGASVQSGDPIRLSEASSDENDNRATPNDGEGKIGNYTGPSTQSGDLFRRSECLRNTRRINVADLAGEGHEKPEPMILKTTSGILKHNSNQIRLHVLLPSAWRGAQLMIGRKNYTRLFHEALLLL